MQRTKVTSSQIDSIGYDPLTSTLEIQFVSRKPGQPGGVYSYSGVPQSVYENLMKTESVGMYFGSNIKGVYSFTKIS